MPQDWTDELEKWEYWYHPIIDAVNQENCLPKDEGEFFRSFTGRRKLLSIAGGAILSFPETSSTQRKEEGEGERDFPHGKHESNKDLLIFNSPRFLLRYVTMKAC